VEATLDRLLVFEDFYRAQHDDLLRAVLYTIGDPEIAADATDEALARAFERWPEVARAANPSGWAYRVALNVARNRLRRISLERRRPVRSPEWLSPAEVADPAMARALAHLNLDQRAVVVLRFHLDWSVEHVATALGVSTGTVKSRLHRALKHLARELEDKG
jgi:RNA polymerase sigma-70 factor (ECF subfamily)